MRKFTLKTQSYKTVTYADTYKKCLPISEIKKPKSFVASLAYKEEFGAHEGKILLTSTHMPLMILDAHNNKSIVNEKC